MMLDPLSFECGIRERRWPLTISPSGLHPFPGRQNDDILLTRRRLTTRHCPRMVSKAADWAESHRRSAVKTLMKPARDTFAAPSSRLLLVIENRMLREAMTVLFRKQSEFSIADSIRYSATAYTQATASDCHVLLADQASAASFPLNFMGDFLRFAPARKVILFGMDDDTDLFLQAVRSGVSGYLLAEASAEDIIAAVRRVVAGEAVCPPWLCHQLFQFVARTTREGSLILNQRLCLKLGLTARQQQLVALMARGFTNKEIAASLQLSEFTVKNHVHRIMRQLNAASRYAAVQTVCDQNLPATI
jgi:DNA-binding NarL/FixJ family response regulator